MDDEEVIGKLLILTVNDIRVQITSSYAGASPALHIPCFALPHIQYARGNALTPEGRKTAQKLLRGVYDACVFWEANEEEHSRLAGHS